MNRPGKHRTERDLQKRAAALGPSDPGRTNEDELLAELIDGTRSLEDADDATLGRMLEREGTAFVAELLADPPRFEELPRPGLHLVGEGARPRPTSIPAPLRLAAAAVGMVGAGLLAFVLSQGSGDGAAGWLQPDGLRVTGRPFRAAGTLGDADTRWGAELRGTLDAELATRLVLVAAGDEGAFGCGLQLADGWILTASSVVESAVRRTSWSGEAARVGVRTTPVGAAPFAEAHVATVHRHRPWRGLTLLRLDGGGDPDLAPLPLVEPADGAEVLQLAASPSMQTLLDARATWSTEPFGPSRSWARQDAGSAGLRGVFEPGAPGSPVLVDRPAGLALAGLVVDARGELGRVAGETELSELWEAAGRAADAPELRPVDPWSLSPGETISPVRAPDVPADWIGRVESTGDRRVVLFRASEAPIEGALPRDGYAPSSPTDDTFPVDLFVVLNDDGHLAIGVCDAAGRVERVWGGERSDAMARWTWSRGADGSWRREDSSRGIPFVNPAWLDRAQATWLEGALGR